MPLYNSQFNPFQSALEKITLLHRGDLRAGLPASGKDELSQIAEDSAASNSCRLH